LANGLTTRVDPHPRAEPHPEAHGVLTTHGLRIEESGPRTKSRTVQGQSPRCGDGGGRVTHDVEKTYPVEAQAFHERVLHNGHVLEKAVIGLFPVPTNLQDGLRVLVYGDTVGKRQTRDLALLLVLKARNVQLAVALI